MLGGKAGAHIQSLLLTSLGPGPARSGTWYL